MKLEKLPKTIMKTLCYIRQDAQLEDLEMFRRIITNAINERKKDKTK